ncbi:hypothetical protein HZ326_13659 [Fusarium oxysporum f. sp. albedinis]|nr:hypothetical protein HZ326_13659 [Fusarium oxysporum f. sp. albedinis]
MTKPRVKPRHDANANAKAFLPIARLLYFDLVGPCKSQPREWVTHGATTAPIIRRSLQHRQLREAETYQDQPTSPFASETVIVIALDPRRLPI